MERFQLPAGVRDILPEECARFDALQSRLRERFAAAGFRFVRPAGLEYYDTFAGAHSPVAQSAMFKMTDRDGNLIVLRPDMTLACARIAATKLGKARADLCYFSDVYDFSAFGNSDREIAQAGVESFGSFGAEADAAIIGFAVECLGRRRPRKCARISMRRMRSGVRSPCAATARPIVRGALCSRFRPCSAAPRCSPRQKN